MNINLKFWRYRERIEGFNLKGSFPLYRDYQMKTSFVEFYVCNSNLAFFLITNTLRCVLELLSSYSNSSTYSQKPSQPNFYIAYFFSIMIFSYTKGRTARPTLNSLAIYLLQGPFALAQVITECCSFALTFFIFY